MPKLLDRPNANVDTKAPVETKPPVGPPPLLPVRREPKRFIRWLGLLTVFVAAMVVAAVTWVNLSSDDPVAGEPWTAQARGIAEFTVESGEPWSPATRGLTQFAPQSPWNQLDRGLPAATEIDIPWTAESRGF